MDPQSNRRPAGRGADRMNLEMAGETVSTITAGADLVLTRHARCLALHHRLVRRRRWSKELDALIGPPSRGWWS